MTRPAPRRLSPQALAHESVDLFADEIALLTSHARKRLLISPRPIGHVWVYSGLMKDRLRERLIPPVEPLAQ